MASEGDGVLRDVTTLSGRGKRLFGLLAAFNLFMFAPLVPSMGLGILLLGVPGAVLSLGLVLLWGVIRITVERDAVVLQQGLRQRRIALSEITGVSVDADPTERTYVLPATRDAKGNETFQVFGAYRMIDLTLRSGQRVRAMSEAPSVVAGAIEAARTAASGSRAEVRVADPDATDAPEEAADEEAGDEASPRGARATRRAGH